MPDATQAARLAVEAFTAAEYFAPTASSATEPAVIPPAELFVRLALLSAAALALPLVEQRSEAMMTSLASAGEFGSTAARQRAACVGLCGVSSFEAVSVCGCMGVRVLVCWCRVCVGMCMHMPLQCHVTGSSGAGVRLSPPYCQGLCRADVHALGRGTRC